MTLRLHVPNLPPPDHHYAAARLADALVEIDDAMESIRNAYRPYAAPALRDRARGWLLKLAMIRAEAAMARDELLK